MLLAWVNNIAFTFDSLIQLQLKTRRLKVIPAKSIHEPKEQIYSLEGNCCKTLA
jgi:hypothetical protein